MTIDCDVLVVGAGPAGSSAARAAAISGAKTIFIDKKREIGVPVQCAEGIGQCLFPFLPFEIPKELLIWKIDGMSFWAEDVTIERTGGFWSGYAINREKFDKWLANNAVNSGAGLWVNTELVGLVVRDEYNITKAIVKTPKGKKEIKPKVVVAADGTDSKVLNLLCIKTVKEGNCADVLSYEVKNIRLDKPNHDQVFFGDFAPGTYGYIFPISKDTANVGIGSLFGRKKMDQKYEEFLEIPIVKKQLQNGVNLKEKSGRVPFRYMTDRWVYENVLLTGDAAAQNIKPFVEGVLLGIICGNIAGQVAAKYAIRQISLDNYEKKIYNKLGALFKDSDKIADIMYELSLMKDKRQYLLRLGVYANIFQLKYLPELKNEDYNSLKHKLEKSRN